MITKGQKINNRYEIIKTIGEGGMANVYLGYDTILDRNVAIKVLRGDLATDEKFVRRFQREALSASSLSHPNIVEVYDVGEDNGLYYIVMEYVEGKTLKQLLKKRGSLTLSEAIDIMLQITDGMAHAHDSYIVHRDLKPQNIMIKDDGQIKITDFGIAMALNSTQLTQTNSVMGSVHYLPPEQAAGKGCTIKSDIYSMGIIFYELLTGELPFKGDSAVEIALKQMKDPLPDVHQMNKDIPQSIENIILKATAKNPKNRYNDVKEMHNDLLTCLNDDRMNEEPYVYPYPEHEVDETTKIMEPVSDATEENIATPIVDKKVKKSSKLIIILSCIAGAIILALVTIFFIIPRVTEEPNVEVPDVSDMTVEDAEKELEKKGFEVAEETRKQNSDEIESGHVIATDPKAGRTLKKGSEITIVESTGKEKYQLEDFVGQEDANKIKDQLEEQYGITVNITKVAEETYDREYDEYEVLDQDPEVGTELDEGDTVTLYIPNLVYYPDMQAEGWNIDAVESFVAKYGLILNRVDQVAENMTSGQVISQGIAPGKQVVSGRTLTVTFAKSASTPAEENPSSTDKTEEETGGGTSNNQGSNSGTTTQSEQKNNP